VHQAEAFGLLLTVTQRILVGHSQDQQAARFAPPALKPMGRRGSGGKAASNGRVTDLCRDFSGPHAEVLPDKHRQGGGIRRG
jgi:hypothetical protein